MVWIYTRFPPTLPSPPSRITQHTVKNDICAEMCMYLVWVELLRIWDSSFLSSCKHGYLCCWFLTYLVLFVRLFFFSVGCSAQHCYLQRHIESLTGNLGVLSNDGFIKK
uniref:Uncharacterized protein n=1 Tax=Nothoprocta perdicaria TaxID=30464 RepID=A0A8C6YVV7_NOTPE